MIHNIYYEHVLWVFGYVPFIIQVLDRFLEFQEKVRLNLMKMAVISFALCKNPQNIAYMFVLTSPAGLNLYSLSFLDGLCDGRQVAIQILFCRVLLLGFV